MSDTNVGFIELAADMAIGALNAWHQARDLIPSWTKDDVTGWAEDAAADLGPDASVEAVASEVCRSAGAPDAAKRIYD